MRLDGHIHITSDDINIEDFSAKLSRAGMDGGVLLSLPPDSLFRLYTGNKKLTVQDRLYNLFTWANGNPLFYPFFWINPMEPDAVEQVKLAVEEGVKGFKIICSNFYPGDPKALKVYHEIARAQKPILFHSGILWDGEFSSRYNRPAEFEALLNVDGLKFALAHVSWPWHDECIAVYGKFLNAYGKRPDSSVEMFIDMTPGTPPIYREEVLTKLLCVGYDIENNLMMGTDNIINEYNTEWAIEWVERDISIYKKLGVDEKIHDKVFCENLKRFVGDM